MKIQNLLTTLFAAQGAYAFVLKPEGKPVACLEMVSRRDIIGTLGSAVLFPQVASAFSQQLDDYAYEPQQQATDGKLDLNAAFVVRFVRFRIFSKFQSPCSHEYPPVLYLEMPLGRLQRPSRYVSHRSWEDRESRSLQSCEGYLQDSRIDLQ